MIAVFTLLGPNRSMMLFSFLYWLFLSPSTHINIRIRSAVFDHPQSTLVWIAKMKYSSFRRESRESSRVYRGTQKKKRSQVSFIEEKKNYHRDKYFFFKDQRTLRFSILIVFADEKLFSVVTVTESPETWSVKEEETCIAAIGIVSSFFKLCGEVDFLFWSCWLIHLTFGWKTV